MRAPEASSSPNLERAQPDDQLAPRMLGAGRVPVPALDGDDPVLVGLHAFPRDHVEACLRQRQQRLAVLGEQVRLAPALAVVVLVAQREAPFEQPGVERRHAPARSAPARTACGVPRRPGTPRRPSRGPRTRCRTRIRTRNAPGTTGTGASASPARTSCAPRPRRCRTRSAAARRPATRRCREAPGTRTQRSPRASAGSARRSNTGNPARNDACATPRPGT